MAKLFPSDHPALEELVLDTVFEFYDAPVLFVARNSLGFPLLVVAVDETDGALDYLAVLMSEQRLSAVRTGLVSLREAFTRPERNNVYHISQPPGDSMAAIRTMAALDVRQDWLPDEGERLAEQLETAAPFSQQALRAAASRENRNLVALEIEQPPALLRTELPLRISGPLMVEFQELADSLAPEADFAFVQLQAASFVVVLAPVQGDRLFGGPSQALEKLESLFAAATTDAFSGFLADLNRRPKSHVRDFFEVLSDAGTGMAFITASPGGRVRHVEVPLNSVRSGLQMLRASRDLESENILLTGYLIAINHAKRTFGVREARATGSRKKPRRFSGKFEPTIEIEGVASGQTVLYRFAILRESQVSDFDETDVKFVHRMMEMTLVSEQGQISG